MRKVNFSLTTAFVLSLTLCFSSPAYAQFPQPWNQVETQPGRCVQQGDVATIQGFECLFANIVRILVPVAGLALFIMLIVGAFQMITSGGDAKQTQKASQTITYAIGGLVAFLAIWFILKLIQAITGVDVTKFVIPGPNP